MIKYKKCAEREQKNNLSALFPHSYNYNDLKMENIDYFIITMLSKYNLIKNHFIFSPVSLSMFSI